MISVYSLPVVWLLISAFTQESSAQGNITDDTVFYGQSPPVYPSRKLRRKLQF